ncbi:UNVERIFIED_CONTAM: glycosyltransferase involved in cell wall biosynthesis [Brevibacillus sp. OAP136]
MTQPCRLTVCMICKDEEQTLQTTLPPLAALADELIFVDTGSADGSVELARRFGAKTHVFPWTDDFGAARNEALRHATGDWIFMADCDDLITRETAALIRAFIQSSSAEAGYVRYENELVTPDRREVLIKYKISLFRNRQNYRYRDPLHETIDDTLGQTVDPAALPFTNITIRHLGYLDQQTVAQKNERNLRIVQKALEKEGDRADLLCFLGSIQLLQGNHTEAWTTLSRAKTNMPSTNPLYAELLHKMATCQLLRKDLDTAVPSWKKLVRFPPILPTCTTIWRSSISCSRMKNKPFVIGRHAYSLAKAHLFTSICKEQAPIWHGTALPKRIRRS